MPPFTAMALTAVPCAEEAAANPDTAPAVNIVSNIIITTAATIAATSQLHIEKSSSDKSTNLIPALSIRVAKLASSGPALFFHQSSLYFPASKASAVPPSH